MRILSTKVHGFLDYAVGLILILSPWIFGFATGGIEQWIPMILGLGAVLYSLATDYEFGLVKLIPMRVHLGIDIASGVLLGLSPWLFGFASVVFLPHLLFGILEIGAGLMTRTEPERPRSAITDGG